jgi:hypothetical protein
MAIVIAHWGSCHDSNFVTPAGTLLVGGEGGLYTAGGSTRQRQASGGYSCVPLFIRWNMLVPVLMFYSVPIGIIMVLVLMTAYRPGSAGRYLFLWPLVCALLTAFVYAIWMFHFMATSKSSTSALGFIVLPSISFAAFMVSWAVLFVVRFARERLGYLQSRVASWWLLIPAILILALAAYVVQHDVRRHLLLKAASGEVAPALRENILTGAVSSDDLDILEALAKNSSMPSDDLIRIFVWSQTTLGNSKPFEYPIFHALAKNPSTPSQLFDVLVKSPASTIRLMVAQNPNAPKEVLRQLAGDPDSLVRNQAETRLRKR